MSRIIKKSEKIDDLYLIDLKYESSIVYLDLVSLFLECKEFTNDFKVRLLFEYTELIFRQYYLNDYHKKLNYRLGRISPTNMEKHKADFENFKVLTSQLVAMEAYKQSLETRMNELNINMPYIKTKTLHLYLSNIEGNY